MVADALYSEHMYSSSQQLLFVYCLAVWRVIQCTAAAHVRLSQGDFPTFLCSQAAV